MDNEKNTQGYLPAEDSDEAYQARRAARMKKLKKRKRGIFLMRLGVLLVLALVIGIVAFVVRSVVTGEGLHPEKYLQKITSLAQSVNLPDLFHGQEDTTEQPQTQAPETDPVVIDPAQQQTQPQTEPQTQPPAVSPEDLAAAQLLAEGYDYDGAIAAIQSLPRYETSPEALEAIDRWQAQKDACVAVDVYTVPHIFYHSLLNDTSRAFNTEVLGQFAVDGMNAWMTTVEEFDKITQQLYDNGYVYVRLRDLVVETENEDGSVSFAPNTQLMLPEGKKAIVLSVDDLSYYHSYYDAGFPDKLVLDENAQVKCQYTDAEGNTTLGDYDVVPRLETFLKEHPDGAYKGARGLIAMTGYNGVFGYRTDQDYEERAHLMEDQANWLAAHPDFDRQEEIAQATVIADALKEAGWEFASHTWGHLSVTGADADRLRTDNERWIANVQNIVGPVDTIIFAHGNDIGDWEGYTPDNEQYAYYHGAGYNFFCNVDGSVPYWVQITSDYVRQGRIDLDGYMLYQSSQGETTVLDQMITASQIFDERRPTPVVANGQG